MKMKNLERLQNWYTTQCDGEWEHHQGISIQSCDNPGWWVKIELAGTAVENKDFQPIEHNVSLAQMQRIADGLEGDPGDRGDDWMLCHVRDNVFDGAGGPGKLDAILGVFLDWTEEI